MPSNEEIARRAADAPRRAIEDRIAASVGRAIAATGCEPAYLHVAPDVWRALGGEGGNWLYLGAVPVRQSRRLPPGYAVPIMPLAPERP